MRTTKHTLANFSLADFSLESGREKKRPGSDCIWAWLGVTGVTGVTGNCTLYLSMQSSIRPQML